MTTVLQPAAWDDHFSMFFRAALVWNSEEVSNSDVGLKRQVRSQFQGLPCGKLSIDLKFHGIP